VENETLLFFSAAVFFSCRLIDSHRVGSAPAASTVAQCPARILGPQSPIQHTHGLKTDTLFYPSQATRASTTRT
jgi:hypothetical protein